MHKTNFSNICERIEVTPGMKMKKSYLFKKILCSLTRLGLEDEAVGKYLIDACRDIKQFRLFAPPSRRTLKDLSRYYEKESVKMVRPDEYRLYKRLKKRTERRIHIGIEINNKYPPQCYFLYLLKGYLEKAYKNAKKEKVLEDFWYLEIPRKGYLKRPQPSIYALMYNLIGCVSYVSTPNYLKEIVYEGKKYAEVKKSFLEENPLLPIGNLQGTYCQNMGKEVPEITSIYPSRKTFLYFEKMISRKLSKIG